jgi:hypothetical protein
VVGKRLPLDTDVVDPFLLHAVGAPPVKGRIGVAIMEAGDPRALAGNGAIK